MPLNRPLHFLAASLTLAALLAGCQSRSPDAVLLKKDPGSSVTYRAPGENDVPYATNVVHVPRDARFSLSLEALNPGWLHADNARHGSATTPSPFSSDDSLAGKDLWLLIHIRTLSSNDALQTETKRISRASLVKYDVRSYGLIPLTVDETTPFALEANTDYEVEVRLYDVKKSFQRAQPDTRPGLSGVARTAWTTTTDTFKSLVGDSATSTARATPSGDLPVERQLLDAGGTLRFNARFAIYRGNDTLAPRLSSDDARGRTLINRYQLIDPDNRRTTDHSAPRFTDSASYLEQLNSLENAETPGRQDAFLRFRVESMWSPVARELATTARVLAAAEGFDSLDPFSRPKPKCHLLGDTPSEKLRLGVPRADQLEWFGNPESPALFAAALDRLRALGIEIIEVDFAPFLDAARLLYEGPWTAERYAAVGPFIEKHSATPEAALAAGLDPTVAQIILGGRTASAADAFRATYRLAELRRAADTTLDTVDALVAPTAGTIYKVSELAADPIRLNSNLGRYNNFMNLLDLCGLTIPAGRYSFGPGFGITFIAPAWHDEHLLTLAARYLGEPIPAFPSSSPAAEITLAVCGAHLRGQPLHSQLTALGARFLSATTTSAHYRLYALANTTPPKPGLARVASPADPGAPITVETYALTPEAFGRFTAAVPAPLVIGNAELIDGSWVKSFLCEPRALAGAADITAHGGWLPYLATRA